MTNTKHTQGPWTVCYSSLNKTITRWHISGPKHGSCYSVCEHVIECEPDGSEQLANANLIASAPELLEALQDLLEKIPTEVWETLPQYIQEQAIKAVDKAKGAPK